MEKQALQAYQEFSEERFTKRIVFKKGDSTVFLLNFMPGQELPKHTHPGTEVFILTIQGEGSFTIDGEEVTAAANETVHLNGSEELAYKNTGSVPVTLYVMLNKIPDDRFAQNI
ncbi:MULTISPECIES: cupin domain-containing protein [Mesobacillus]|uniref:Cupin n=2 Tax=Mesobacillus TaxID=2675231 RepID=A0A0D6ZAD5_9BACI|nr:MULTISPECIES: cupin domain-containing protein [Mesobacillus]KIY22482.1 cupin [Mesobacillus subterraneus]MDQ0413893.1 quercetin dioxygenase-like cupin family protein [Mesobacillus stamsii]